MKNRNLKHKDHWATPAYFLESIKKEFGEYYDPCHLHATFDGLSTDWGAVNFINPPYSQELK